MRPDPIPNAILAMMIVGALWSVGVACSTYHPANDHTASAETFSSRHMPDGTEWTTDNIQVNIAGSFCYADAEVNCRRYGRLYTWESAERGCQSLPGRWRLPTDDEWRRLAKQYGGVREDSNDSGTPAYKALVNGGNSGFRALLGGDRAPDDGHYERLEAHGFYWTASEIDRVNAWFYNFGQGGLSLNRHREGDKRMALSVRCVR
jgi:uncharacterized protein (TIGR02145 family)